MAFNAGQTEVYEMITSRNFTQLLLTGAAGSGKTYVLTQALAELHRQGVNVVLAAPTHMARINLVSKMPEDVRHEMSTTTVASLLSRHGFTVGDGSTGFTRAKTDRLGRWEVIAIDEVSMLGKGDFDVLKSSGAKIIYTGDFAQLPTVMQRRSNMEDDPDLQRFHLDEQMRAHGPIHQVAEANREEVFFPEENIEGEDSSVIVHETKTQLIERMCQDIVADSRGREGHTSYRYICHSNDEVGEVGKFVRDMVLTHEGENTKSPFVVGEFLLLYATTPAGYNGETVRITGVRKDPNVTAHNSFPWDSYQIEVEGSRGTCFMAVCPPEQNNAMSELLTHLQDRIKIAQKARALDEVNSLFSQITHIKTYWTKVGYPFAVTCHKSQGMTIENVYVNTLSFAKASNKRALLYVGLSRASKMLHTVVVPKPRWKVVREINEEYRKAKAEYEAWCKVPNWKFRKAYGLSARTPEDKKLCAGMLRSAMKFQTKKDQLR